MTSAVGQPSLLILSFSDIRNDARVMKQVKLFARRYRVTTCGYGESPHPGVEHIRIPDEQILGSPYGRLLSLRLYRRAYAGLRVVTWCRANLKPRQWDVVLANDVDAIPVALELAPAYGVHADLHEYAPRVREERPAWNKTMRPYYEWLCRRFVRRASSWTTVGGGLAREYAREFGFKPVVVTNAAPFANLEPTPIGPTMRLVHSGACLRSRNLMTMIEGATTARQPVTLDMYLTPNDPGYLAELKERASRLDGVTINDPVPYESLIEKLNDFDVGLFVLEPVNFNYRWALPNKLFDFVQARLAVVIGPSEEMKSYVDEFGFGVVTDDWSAESLARTLDELSVESVIEMKSRSHASARELSSDAQVALWESAIAELVGR